MDLIAPENGIVKKMTVSQGEAKVKAGDTVKKGQVLVQGVNGKKAIAKVDIVLYYHASDVIWENRIEMVPTGEEEVYSYLDVFGLKIGNNKPANYAYYEYEVNETQISLNLFAPIKKVVVKYKKLEQKQVKVNFDEEVNVVERQLTKELAKRAGLSENDMTKTITILTNLGGGCHELNCYLEIPIILTI